VIRETPKKEFPAKAQRRKEEKLPISDVEPLTFYSARKRAILFFFFAPLRLCGNPCP
jgi:hypothetical protein